MDVGTHVRTDGRTDGQTFETHVITTLWRVDLKSSLLQIIFYCKFFHFQDYKQGDIFQEELIFSNLLI